jgi:hypothetical protein
MSKISTQSQTFALLAVAAIALAACGGSRENSSSDSTAAARTKNAALPTETTVSMALPTYAPVAALPAPVALPTQTTVSEALPTATTVSKLSCATGGVCVVGDIGPGGGKVFYVAPASFTSTGSACGSACKYLQAAPNGWITAASLAGQTYCGVPFINTEDPRCEWGSVIFRSRTTSKAIGAGYVNTSRLASLGEYGNFNAATVARAFQGGGKTDWYLPSLDELNQMYLQRSAIGGFSSGFYWSSSEDDELAAWGQVFNTGYQANSNNKSGRLYVRPVRAF